MTQGLKVFFGGFLLLLVITVVVQFFFCVVLQRPQYEPLSSLIPLFYFANLAVLAVFVHKYRGQSPSLRATLSFKTVKIFAALLVLLLGLLLKTSYAVYFVGEFAVYFIAFLMFETYVLYRLNKNTQERETGK